jgi:hypothetical protein
VKVRVFRNIKYSIFNIQSIAFAFGITLTALFFISPVCFAIDLPKTAELVPPQTIVLVDIEDYGRLKEQFEKISLYRFYKDPQMKAFVEHVKSKWRENLKEMDENNMFRALFEADVEPQGRLAMAMVPDEQVKDANESPMLIITQWGPNITKIKEIVARVIAKNVELGGHSKPSQTFRGVTIEEAVDEIGTPFSYCFIDDCFISSLHLEGLKFVIAQLKGATSPTLADDADYQAAIRSVGSNDSLSLYINIKQMIKTAIAEDSQGRTQAALTNLGLDNVRSFGASVDMDAGPQRPYIVKALLKINGSKKGICKILETESAPLRIPGFIPADTYRLSVVNLDLKKIYGELSSVLMTFGPMLTAPLYTPLVPASPDGQPAVMLKEDVIDHLASQIIIAQSLKKPFSENQFPAEYLVAMATTNRTALEKSLAAWHSKKIAPDDPEAKRELLGHTLYLIKSEAMPFLPGPGGAEPMAEDESKAVVMPVLAFTVTDTHLICGLESSLEKAIRTLKTGESISDARWFNRARTALPDRTGMLSLEDTRAAVEFLWWLLKQARKDPGQAALAAPTASYVFSDFDLDFSLLPEYEKVSRYFGLTASYVMSRDDGFYMELVGIDQPPD